MRGAKINVTILLLMITLTMVSVNSQIVSNELGVGFEEGYNLEYNSLGINWLNTTSTASVNYSSVEVNNSQFLQGYTPTTLQSLFQTAFNSIYCTLTGCTMAGNINMGSNNIFNAGDINATSFYGDGSGLTGVATGYPHDQGLNTTQNVSFLNVNITEDLYVRDIYASNNSIYLGEVKMTGNGSDLVVDNGSIQAEFFVGDGSQLTNLNLTDVTIDGGYIQANNISAVNVLELNGTEIYDWSVFEVAEYEEIINITTSGGVASAQSSNLLDFEISQIIVTPTTANTNYRFQATESDGDMIDRDRKVHVGVWNIEKSHVINDYVNISITSASNDELFTIRIKYLDNYT